MNRVTDVPKEFKQWIKDNAERIDKAKSMPYFITDNEDEVNALMWLSAERYKEFRRLKSGSNYYDVKCNALGGIKATHKGHNFDKKGGGEHELMAQNAGFNVGDVVILEDEDSSIFNQKHLEGYWNGKLFEVAWRKTATSSNILRGLKHCAEKKITEYAVLVFDEKLDLNVLKSAIARYKGLEKLNDGQFLKFERIICVERDKIIYNEVF